MKRLLFVLVFLVFLDSAVLAQLSRPGSPPGFSPVTVDTGMVFERMPEVDVIALLAEDRLLDSRTDVPWRFGKNIDVALSPDNSGIWHELPDGSRLWRLGISSPGAYSLNLLFDNYYLPEGAELYIYSASASFKEYYLGAFTHLNNQDDGYFATTLVPGDSIIVEYLEPSGVAFRGRLNISRVTHAYRDPMRFTKAFGDSGYCNVNVACEIADGWEDQINSVVLLLSGGSSFCSGVFVNNTNNDGRPLLLSANHCFRNRDPETVVAWFNWQSETCEDPVTPPPHNALSGAVLLSRNSTSDFLLMEMNHSIPESYNPYFAGWNRDLAEELDETLIGIHHPRGDIKKFSYSESGVQASSYLGPPGSGLSHWRITWDGGTTTEPGSSGSPIFDDRGRLLGQLHGGYAACGNTEPDWYGRFGVSWTGGGSPENSLGNWLDPIGSSPRSVYGFDPFAEQIPEVVSFIATPGDDNQIILNWTPNTDNDHVLIAVSTDGEFGSPAGYYTIEDEIRGGGRVIYIGSDTEYNVSGLEAGREYFFRIWSFSKTPVYSKGMDAQARISCPVLTLPFSEYVLTSGMPPCWQEEILDGNANWGVIHSDDIPFGSSAAGEYSLFFPGGGENEGSEARIISPLLDLSGYELAEVSFCLSMPDVGEGSGNLRILYRDNEEGEWTVVDSFNEAADGWTYKRVELQPGKDLFQVGFEAESKMGGGVFVDKISVNGKYSGDFPVPVNIFLIDSGHDWVELGWEHAHQTKDNGHRLAGFGIYRDGKNIDTIDDPNSQFYIDTGLAVGDYEYQVSAIYEEPDFETGLTGEEKLQVSITAGETTYRLDIDTIGPGSVIPLPGTYYYNQGARPSLKAYPENYSSFFGWEVNSGIHSQISETVLEMDQDKEVDAVFRRNIYSLSVGSSPPGIGEQTGVGSYSHGSVAIVSTSVPPDRNFFYWSKEGQVISTRQTFPFRVTGDTELKAHFSSYIFEISSGVYPMGSGTVSGSGEYEEGSVARLEALSGNEYVFMYWEEDGIKVHHEEVYEFVVTGERTLTAVFELKQYELNVNISPEAGGSTNPLPGSYAYTSGENVSLDANASSGWTFGYWVVNGQIVNSEGTLEILMAEDTDVTAVFDREEIVVYPNPAYDILNIEWPAGKEIKELRLSDINGNIVVREQPSSASGDVFGQARIYLPGDAQGLYILTVLTGDDTLHFKVIVY